MGNAVQSSGSNIGPPQAPSTNLGANINKAQPKGQSSSSLGQRGDAIAPGSAPARSATSQQDVPNPLDSVISVASSFFSSMFGDDPPPAGAKGTSHKGRQPTAAMTSAATMSVTGKGGASSGATQQSDSAKKKGGAVSQQVLPAMESCKASGGTSVANSGSTSTPVVLGSSPSSHTTAKADSFDDRTTCAPVATNSLKQMVAAVASTSVDNKSHENTTQQKAVPTMISGDENQSAVRSNDTAQFRGLSGKIVGLRKIPSLNGETATIVKERDATHWEVKVKDFVAIVHKRNVDLFKSE